MIVVKAEMELNTEITVGLSANMGSLELTIKSFTTEDLRELSSLLEIAIQDEESKDD